MAVISANGSRGHHNFTLTLTETSTSAANNTSTISYLFKISPVVAGYDWANWGNSISYSFTINGTSYSGTIPGYDGRSTVTLKSGLQTVTHGIDGKKTISFSFSVTDNAGQSYTPGNASASGTMKLTDLPRNATVTQSNPAKTETDITISWTSNAVIDYIWYSSNNGSSWTGIDVTDGTSGTYTISGLTADTTYHVKTRVRRKDNQLTTDSTAMLVTTYAYPYANVRPNFNVGDRLTINIFNPLQREVTVTLIGADNSEITSDTITGTSVTGYDTPTIVNALLASTPNAATATYKVKVTYESIETTTTGGTYTVGSAYAPSIGVLSYEDIKASVIAITGNKLLIVRNQSQVEFTANGLTALQGATIASCTVNVNGNNYSLTISGSMAYGGYDTIDSASDLTVTFTVTDSRGISATKELTVTMLDWTIPSALIMAQRQSNYYSETDINVNAYYSSVDGKNSVTIQCRYKKTSDSSYSNWVTLQDEVTSVLSLDNLYEWNVQVKVTDLFGGTATYNLVIPLGMPIIYFDRIKNSVGINCFPQDNRSLEVNGKNLAPSIMKAFNSSPITNLTANAYTKITLDSSVSTGNNLTLSNGGILIGTGVNYIKVSGVLRLSSVGSRGDKQLRIYTDNDNTVLGWANLYMDSGEPCSIVIPPTLVSVSAGETIYLYYSTNESTDTIGGNGRGNSTSLTVEVV